MKHSPPYRADHVGSLLRPAEVQKARASFSQNEIGSEELAEIEDAAIKRIIARQESIGLQSVTDGEIRRETWLGDFLLGLDGTTAVVYESSLQPHREKSESKGKPHKINRITGKIGFSSHPMIEHFRFLNQHTKHTAKMTIPAPAMLLSASRDWRQVVDRDVYPDINEFYHDVGITYRDVVRAFYDAGCRYLQFDDVNLAYFCDPDIRKQLESRGDHPDEMLEKWISVVETAISGRPADMHITTHICRGNFRSKWFVQGGYEPIAERLFNRFDYNGYFLEYDTDRAGSFEPLRFLPKGAKAVVLGLVTTKSGELEDRAKIKARIEEAAEYVSLDQLCLSPQCGFASTEEGNLLTEEEQWDKLALIVDVASEVWPDA